MECRLLGPAGFDFQAFQVPGVKRWFFRIFWLWGLKKNKFLYNDKHEEQCKGLWMAGGCEICSSGRAGFSKEPGQVRAITRWHQAVEEAVDICFEFCPWPGILRLPCACHPWECTGSAVASVRAAGRKWSPDPWSDHTVRSIGPCGIWIFGRQVCAVIQVYNVHEMIL